MNPKKLILSDHFGFSQNIQSCALVTSKIGLLSERDHHLAPDAQVLVFLIQVVGVRVIATLRMEIGAPNVFPVQVNDSDSIKVFYMSNSNM